MEPAKGQVSLRHPSSIVHWESGRLNGTTQIGPRRSLMTPSFEFALPALSWCSYSFIISNFKSCHNNKLIHKVQDLRGKID